MANKGVDQTGNQYNNKFKLSDNFSQVLYKPDKPLFQSDLNEMQSILSSKISLLGSSWFKDGAILSGMKVTTKGKTGEDTSTANKAVSKNLLSLSNVSSNNSAINTSNWVKEGGVSVTPFVTVSNSYPGIEIIDNNIPGSDNTVTLSFSIKADNGILKNLYGSYESGVNINKYVIDNSPVATALNSQIGAGLVSSDGSQINLSDGNWHTVAITFSNISSNTFKFLLGANVGYNMLNSENSVSYTIKSLAINSGSEASQWELSTEDSVGKGSNVRNTLIQVDDGTVFLNGEPRVFNSQTIAITGHGTETIGMNLVENVVTPQDDYLLRDTTNGSNSYWDESSDRLHYSVELAYNDPQATTLVTLKDGIVATKANENIDQMAKLNSILATRTNDESGSYLVEGFGLWTKPNKGDSSKVSVIVDPGRAYVLGYGIYPTVSNTIDIDKSTIPGDDLSEPLKYNPDNPMWGTLANQPVQQIKNLSGFITGSTNMNRGSTDTDALDEHIYQIDKLYTGDGTVYTAKGENGSTYDNYDYRFDQATHSIRWNTNTTPHKKIPTNSTYYIDYQQTYNFHSNEFKLVTPDGKEAYTGATDINKVQDLDQPVVSISFEGFKIKPALNSIVTVNYTYFLARADIITLDSNGQLHSIKGQPEPLTQVQPPNRIDPNTLQLGYVTLYPNSYRSICDSSSIKRITEGGLQDMVTRIQNLEQQVQAVQLNSQANLNQDPTTMQGAFIDNFTSSVYGDFTNRDFNVSYDFARQAITLPTLASKDFNKDNPNGKLSIDPNGTTNIHQFPGSVITPEFTERPLVSQLLATQDPININPQGSGHYVKEGVLSIEPNTDTWTDKRSNVQYVQGTKTHTDVSWWWAHNNTNVMPGMLQGYTGDQIINQYPLDPGYNWNMYGQTVKSTKNRLQSSDSNTEIQTYARPRQIIFHGTGFLANADNLQVTMDGISMNVTPTGSTTSGSQWNSLKADGNGNVEGYFTIPAGTIKTGSRNVVVKNGNNTASAMYQSTGLTVTNDQVILQDETDLTIIDPVAESINIAPEMGTGLLTSVGLYFASKDQHDDNPNNEVTVQLRRMGDQGYPTQTVLNGKGTKVEASQIHISKDASIETRVYFDTPVPFKPGDSFAITILSNSDDYTLYRNTYGMPRLGGTSEDNTVDGYPQGMLFESTNSQTWVASEHDDLKFNLYQGIFNPNAVIEFKTIDLTTNDADGKPYYYTLNDDGTQTPITKSDGTKVAVNVSDFAMMLASLTYSNTGMNWQIKILGRDAETSADIKNVNWQPVQNGDTVDKNITDAVQGARQIRLRAEFRSDNKDTSSTNCAITSLNGITLGAVLTGVRGAYISRNVDESAAPFNAIQTNFVASIPKGTSVDAYYSVDVGKSWYKYPIQGLQVTDVGNDDKQYSFRVRFGDQNKGDYTTYKNFKIRLELYSNNVFKKPYISKLTNSFTIQDGDETGRSHYSLTANYAQQKEGPIAPLDLPIMTTQKNFDLINNETGFANIQ